jgi:hypothetical protein
MKFSEAMQSLRDGKKVSMPGWSDIYIKGMSDEDGERIESFNMVVHKFLWDLNTLLEGCWLIGRGDKPSTFEDVIYALRMGATARKTEWVDRFIKLDKDTGEIIQISYAPFPFNPAFRDLLREDWFVVGENK